MADQDITWLLHVIWYITHKQDEKMQSTMAYIKEFLEFATTYQEPKQPNTEYYALFKSRRDTVTAYGRHPGYHLKLYVKHWKILMVAEGVIDEQAIDTEKQEEYAQLTLDLSFKESCSCLFMRQSDNKRYKQLKEKNKNAFLMVNKK